MNPLTNSWQRSQILRSLHRWFDSSVPLEPVPSGVLPRQRWRNKNYLLMHLPCLGVIWVGWTWTAVGVAAGLYVLRMIAITGFYHRYFSHRTFKTSRFWQFCFAVLGNSSAQRGPLWWAAHHRHHHQKADTNEDVHSPTHQGFWWSHIGWLTDPANFSTRWEYVKDWAKFPELVWLNRFDKVVPISAGRHAVCRGRGSGPILPPPGHQWGPIAHLGFFYLHHRAVSRHLHHQFIEPSLWVAPL
jgi:stearoyl-CoA desaturase (delta-9 desaturase)